MNWFGKSYEHPWGVTVAAIGGLLVAIIVVGVVGLVLNRDIQRAAGEALRYDVQIEDGGDDLRAATFEVRHYHRNLLINQPTTRGDLANFEGAYKLLSHELDELERLGVSDPDYPQPDEIRAMAEEYYQTFRPAVDVADTDQRAFEEAGDKGLRQLAELEAAASKIDEFGERLSAGSFQRVDQAATRATWVMTTVISGLLLAGTVLAYATMRVVKELRAASEKIAEASRAKTDFLADASHELRTPLTVVQGNAQIGLTLDGSPDHIAILDDIVKESGRMTRMVEDLLFLVRSDSASLPLETQTVPVASLLAELAERAEALAHERGTTLAINLSGEGEIEVDQSRVEQAILILIDNAAKYGPPEGTVTLSAEARTEKLRVTVADEGPGIPEEELGRVFERFYRMDKTRSRKLGGSGLGLSIAKTIAEAHGGHIEAESQVGEGTKMSIYLPMISGTKGKGSEAASSKGRARRS
jgi:two-component system, OmpR family, sensor histidine kinase VicK